MWLFFFSSRRRHTRCALVTGVQTCALPILPELAPKHLVLEIGWGVLQPDIGRGRSSAERLATTCQSLSVQKRPFRSEERRVGKECVSTCRSRWSQYH